MPNSTIFQLFQVDSFIGGGNHRPVTDKLYHIMLIRVHLAMSGIRICNISVDRH